MRNENENCTNCVHCVSQRASEVSIEKVLICVESPPDTVVLPAPNGQLMFIPAKRIVAPDIWCSKYRPLQPTETMPTLIS